MWKKKEKERAFALEMTSDLLLVYAVMCSDLIYAQAPSAALPIPKCKSGRARAKRNKKQQQGGECVGVV